MMSDFRRLVLLTSTLPIDTEIVNSSIEGPGTSAASRLKILTDFEPSATPYDMRSVLQYAATNPYRLLSMNTETAVDEIDLAIYWEDPEQILHELLIPIGQTISIKLMFIKKELFKGRKVVNTIAVPSEEQKLVPLNKLGFKVQNYY
jgi:hypothetical protein